MCAARARELTVRSSMRPLNLSGTQVSNHLVGKRPRSGSCCRSACTLLGTWQLNKANPTCCKSARYFLDWTCLSEKHAATPESRVSRCWYEHLIAFVRVALHSRITELLLKPLLQWLLHTDPSIRAADLYALLGSDTWQEPPRMESSNSNAWRPRRRDSDR